MQSNRQETLSVFFIDWVAHTIGASIINTIGYIGSYTFALSAIAAMNWTTLIGLSIVGSLVIHFPYMSLQGIFKSNNLLSYRVKELLDLVYQIGAPLIGAVILNYGFGLSIPLLPILICTSIGIGLSYVLEACWNYCCKAEEQSINHAEQHNPETLRIPEVRHFLSATQQKRAVNQPPSLTTSVIIKKPGEYDNIIGRTEYLCYQKR